MRIYPLVLVAGILVFQPTVSMAADLVTIPAEISKNMKKGKKLDLVWTAPGFDGTKGVRLGPVLNDSDDSEGVTVQHFPVAIRRFIQADSPYTLHIAVVFARLTSLSRTTSAQVEVEGQVMDQKGAVVAAFNARSTATVGGTARDNARLAVNAIAFSMAKDLFTSALPVETKDPEIIVPTPVATPKAPTASVGPLLVQVPAAAPTIQPSAIQASQPSSPPLAGAVQPVPPQPASVAQQPPTPPSDPGLTASAAPTAPAATIEPSMTPTAPSVPPVPSPQPPSPQSQMTPAVAVPAVPKPAIQPEVIAALIPLAMQRDMTRGSALGQVWISPAYDKPKGFSIGEVRYMVEKRNSGISDYLPGALAQLAKENAPCRLEMHITELVIRTSSNRSSGAKLGVEGRLITKDGNILAVFRTREEITGTGDSVDDCLRAARKVVQAIQTDLR